LSANIQTDASDANLLAVVKDSERFVLRFFDVIELSAAHIYESALPLSPSSSLVRATYQDQVPMDTKFRLIDDTWDACIRAIRLQDFTRCVKFSHRDDLIAVGEESAVEIFDATTGQRRAMLRTDYVEDTLAFSHDDNTLATVYGGTVNIWDLQTGGRMGSLNGSNLSIAFSPCGNMIATGSYDHTVRVWNTLSLDCRCVLEGHSDCVWTICWLASGSQVVSGSSDNTVKVWSIFDNQCSPMLTIRAGDRVISVASSPDSSLIAAASENRAVIVFDARTGGVLHRIDTSFGWTRIRFLNRDQIMCDSEIGMFKIWDLTKSADVLTFKYDGESGAMSSDGTRLVSHQGNVVKIWQTDISIQNQDTTHHHTEGVNDITFSRDGQLVASASEDMTVKIWDTPTGQCLTTFSDHLDAIRVAVLSPDSTLCASYGWGSVIRIWNVRTGHQVSTMDESVKCMCLSPDNSQLVSHTWKDELKLWDVATGHCLASRKFLPRSKNLSLDFDGISIIMTGSNGKKLLGRWTLSSAPHPNHIDDSTQSHLSPLPMVFVPIDDTETSTLPDKSPHQYYSDEQRSWILDKQNRRRLWIPPDSKINCHGEKVAFGSGTGTVTVVDFSSPSIA
jgi:WD40 repeat protein